MRKTGANGTRQGIITVFGKARPSKVDDNQENEFLIT